jgi:hypothetical protein
LVFVLVFVLESGVGDSILVGVLRAVGTSGNSVLLQATLAWVGGRVGLAALGQVIVTSAPAAA